MTMLVRVNGKFFPKEEACVSVFDHGYLYGDGVFEGIRSYNGRVFRLDEHIRRLYLSGERISLKIPLTREEMAREVLETLRKNNLKDAYIRLIVSRGPGDLGLDPRKCQNPTVVVITDKITLYPGSFYEKGLKIAVVSTLRNDPRALDPRIKSLNYLNNILGKIEAIEKNASEGVMLNKDGFITECTGDNLFMVKNGRILTSPVHLGVLEGITRRIIFELGGSFALPVEEKEITVEELYRADECFLTGTAAEIVPVVMVDDKKIKNGLPGEITLKLTEAFIRMTQREGVSV